MKRSRRVYSARIKTIRGTARVKVSQSKSGICTAMFNTTIRGLSAAHLHANVGGKPGPILHWLGTTQKWAEGVAQNTPLSNSPCCNNRLCTLAAPSNTPRMRQKITRTLRLGRNKCKGCRSLKGNLANMFLVLHGTKYKTVKNCKQSHKSKSGLNVVGVARLRLLKTK
jgi:hypothetical protein